jgi:2-keto-myo-inositol isomerase
VTPAIYLNGATLMTTPTQRVLAIARTLGYAGIEARAERLLNDVSELHSAAQIARPAEVLALNGVALTLHRDGRVNRDVLDEDLAPRLRICKEVGSPYLLAIPPRAPGVKTAPAIAGTREALEHAREHAAAANVRIAFEFLGFADCPINTPALAAETVDGVDGIELVIDASHWHASGSMPLGNFPIERIALVHLNDVPAKPPGQIEDGDRVFPGEGVIKLAELIGELRAGGYSGPWSLETFNPSYWQEAPEAVARRGLAAMDRITRETAT